MPPSSLDFKGSRGLITAQFVVKLLTLRQPKMIIPYVKRKRSILSKFFYENVLQVTKYIHQRRWQQ